jgi:hypothetical protein
VDEVDQVGAEGRVLENHVASLADQAVAEHQSVLLVAQFDRQGSDARNNLEGRFEQTGQRVADRAGDAAQRGHPEGYVADDLDGGTAGLVHDAHRDLGHDQHREDQHDCAQPLPALQFLGAKA